MMTKTFYGIALLTLLLLTACQVPSETQTSQKAPQIVTPQDASNADVTKDTGNIWGGG